MVKFIVNEEPVFFSGVYFDDQGIQTRVVLAGDPAPGGGVYGGVAYPEIAAYPLGFGGPRRLSGERGRAHNWWAGYVVDPKKRRKFVRIRAPSPITTTGASTLRMDRLNEQAQEGWR